MEPSGIIAILIAALGTGGAIGALIQALAGRGKVKAETGAIDWNTLGLAFKQLGESTDCINKMSKELLTAMRAEVDKLEQRVTTLESELGDREVKIAELTAENKSLRRAVERLQTEAKEKDIRIKELLARVDALTKRIEGMAGSDPE